MCCSDAESHCVPLLAHQSFSAQCWLPSLQLTAKSHWFLRFAFIRGNNKEHSARKKGFVVFSIQQKFGCCVVLWVPVHGRGAAQVFFLTSLGQILFMPIVKKELQNDNLVAGVYLRWSQYGPTLGGYGDWSDWRTGLTAQPMGGAGHQSRRSIGCHLRYT